MPNNQPLLDLLQTILKSPLGEELRRIPAKSSVNLGSALLDLLGQVTPRTPEPPTPPASPPDPKSLAFFASVGAALPALVLTESEAVPQLTAAIHAQDWVRVAAIAALMQRMGWSDKEGVSIIQTGIDPMDTTLTTLLNLIPTATPQEQQPLLAVIAMLVQKRVPA